MRLTERPNKYMFKLINNLNIILDTDMTYEIVMANDLYIICPSALMWYTIWVIPRKTKY